MVGWRQQMLKLHLLKRPKTVSKKNLVRKENIQNLIFEIFIFSFRFQSRKSQSQQTPAIEFHSQTFVSFTIQFLLKNVTHFSNLISINIVKHAFPKPSETPSSIYKFSQEICSRTAFAKHLGRHLFYLFWSSFDNIRNSNYNFMQWWSVEIKGDRRGKLNYI